MKRKGNEVCLLSFGGLLFISRDKSFLELLLVTLTSLLSSSQTNQVCMSASADLHRSSRKKRKCPGYHLFSHFYIGLHVLGCRNSRILEHISGRVFGVVWISGPVRNVLVLGFLLEADWRDGWKPESGLFGFAGLWGLKSGPDGLSRCK